MSLSDMSEAFNTGRGNDFTEDEDSDFCFPVIHPKEAIVESATLSAIRPALETSPEGLMRCWAVIHRQLSQSNPARLDLTQVPRTEKDLGLFSNFHRKVYKTYHKYTVFELDMIHCTDGYFTGNSTGYPGELKYTETSGEGIKAKRIFYPAILFPESSHKRSIRKLALRFMLKDYENKSPNPEGFPRTLGGRERTWMKRTLESIPTFSNLEYLDITITYDHKSPKTLEWDEGGNCHWPDYKQSLSYCLDRLTYLSRLRVTVVGTSKTLIKWLIARYGFEPSIHENDKWTHHFEYPDEVAGRMGKATIYEWNSMPDFLEFEKEEDVVDEEVEFWDSEEEYDVEIVDERETEEGAEGHSEELCFDELVTRTEIEFFGPDGVDGLGAGRVKLR